MHRYLAALLLGLTLASSGSQVFAHAQLVEATPPADSTITASPTEVRLSFNERIEPRFSGVEITSADGQKVSTGRLAVRGKDIVVPLSQPLAPGVYRVNWHLLSVDGHKVRGNFRFEVKP